MVSKMNSNYNYFLKADMSKYMGKWVIITDNKVVASGGNAKKTYEDAKKKYPKKSFFLRR